jgi:spore coat protein A
MSRGRSTLTALALGALAFVSLVPQTRAQPLPGGTLDPLAVPKFTQPLVIPPVMPPSADDTTPYYEIEVVQFQQQILPPGLPTTTVWSYGAVGRPETRNYPAFTIEALKDVPTRVKWVNGLVDDDGKFLKHLLPIDQTIHWANPGMTHCRNHGGMAMSSPQDDAACQAPYEGPVPIITHLHGAHVDPESDGYPEAWYLPNATNLGGYVTRGPAFGQVAGVQDEAGAATFEYRNDQPATTLWFHDHTLGMTRANVYAGPAGFYLLRDPANVVPRLPGPAPVLGDDPNGNARVRASIREIPIAIQDRSFNSDGSLFYPDNRDFFEGLAAGELAGLGVQFSPEGGSDIAPIWNPEFFGNTMVVNGRTWPKLDVDRAKYRFRLLNGSNSRFLILRFEGQALTFHQIGADQGFLPATVPQTRLLLGPAERADVIVDFATLPPGRQQIVLENIGPDEPFGGGVPCVDDAEPCDFPPSDPGTTGVVMAFVVKGGPVDDAAQIPSTLPAEQRLSQSRTTRRLSLNELMSMNQAICVGLDGFEPKTGDGSCPAGTTEEMFGPAAAQLGTMKGGKPVPLPWSDPITEQPVLGSTETWEIYNFTADAHPIHLHLVRFNVLNRQALKLNPLGEVDLPVKTVGGEAGPEAWEVGYKDTVIAYPGQVTRIRAKFDIAGLYVWHCHILEHEDNEMMRPFYVVDPAK